MNRSYILAIAVLLLPFSIAAEETSLAVVFRDDFDEDIDQWTFSEEPEAVIAWNGKDGFPRLGSINLSLPRKLNHSDSFQALGPCMSASPGETWQIETMIKAKPNGGGRCFAFVSYFNSADCTGEGSVTGGGGGARPLEAQGWWLEERTGRTFTQTRSVRAILVLPVFSRSGPTTCHFDSVVISNNRIPALTDVPTLSTLGLAVLASLLTLAAFVLRRRVSRSWVCRGGHSA